MEANGQDTVLTQYSRRIMLSSIIIVIAACAMVVLFHIYSKWCAAGEIQQSTRHRYTTTTTDAVLAWKGLDPAVVDALPSFVYESESRESTLECAVCLSEFEDGEKGRLLPECKHSFHVDCIDMWFRSHSDCPLCRSRVNAEAIEDGPVRPAEDLNEVIISVMLPEDLNEGSGSRSVHDVVPRPGQMGENPSGDVSGSDVNVGSDIESGQRPTIGWVKVLKSKRWSSSI